MTTLFAGPPKPQTPQALPQTDDASIAAAKARTFAKQDQASGAGGNQLTETKLGDSVPAVTRTGAMPKPAIITG